MLLRAEVPILAPPEGKTEIEIIEKESPSKKQKYYAPDIEDGDLREQLNNQADFIAALSKRVKKQMVARKGDKDINADQAKVKPDTSANRERGLTLPGGLNEPMRTVAIGPSSVKTHVPGIEEGSFTALNKQQFTYYSFFYRSGEQIGNRWRDGLVNLAQQLKREEFLILAKARRETVIEVLLTKEGHFSRAYLLKSSGDRRLDLLPFEAFRAAAPFMNPPKGLVDADGMIRLKYAFVVDFRPPNFGPDIH